MSAVLLACGLLSKGGNPKTVWDRIAHLGIDATHIRRGPSSNKGRKFVNTAALPLEQVLVENSTYSRFHLKKRILKHGLIENKCAKCGMLPVWNNEPLVLRLDHINGINNDNRLENLQFLCPNCDSQSSTFCGRNGSKRWYCIECGVKVSKGHLKCRPHNSPSPRPNQRKIMWPTLPELQAQIAASNVWQVSKQLGVSDQAVHRMLARMLKREALKASIPST
jgi:ribosomal protein L37AE/L43A